MNISYVYIDPVSINKNSGDTIRCLNTNYDLSQNQLQGRPNVPFTALRFKELGLLISALEVGLPLRLTDSVKHCG